VCVCVFADVVWSSSIVTACSYCERGHQRAHLFFAHWLLLAQRCVHVFVFMCVCVCVYVCVCVCVCVLRSPGSYSLNIFFHSQNQ
jgi:hypothetical protein